MHDPTDRIAYTTAFDTPDMEHWLEWEIAQWVHQEELIWQPIAPWVDALPWYSDQRKHLSSDLYTYLDPFPDSGHWLQALRLKFVWWPIYTSTSACDCQETTLIWSRMRFGVRAIFICFYMGLIPLASPSGTMVIHQLVHKHGFSPSVSTPTWCTVSLEINPSQWMNF